MNNKAHTHFQTIAIFCGLFLGIILGLAFPQQSWIGIFGQLFVGALKAIAPILVFFLVSSSISKASPNIGRRFRTVVILYLLTTLLAAVTAVIVSYIFPLTLPINNVAASSATVEISNTSDMLNNMLLSLIENPLNALIKGNYIAILLWSILFGVGLKTCASKATIDVVSDISDAISKVVRFVIRMVPLGIMGLVFTAVSTNGIAIFQDYGSIILIFCLGIFTSAFIVNPLIISILLKKNPYKLVFRCIGFSGFTAFFTRSSAANIPINMKLCEKLGLDKDLYSVSIPLGSTINMNGAAITITTLTLALCHTLGIQTNPLLTVALSIVAVIGACGASGVAGGSLLLIPMACSLFGINNDLAMQAVAIGFIIGVIQDSVETAHNSSSDAIFTATADYYERLKNGKEMNYLGSYAHNKNTDSESL